MVRGWTPSGVLGYDSLPRQKKFRDDITDPENDSYSTSFFSLEVQPLTKFPKPADCLPLFRFGFDLQPEVWEYFLMTDKTKILVNERVQCGFPGITKFHCVAIRGCCFDDESGM